MRVPSRVNAITLGVRDFETMRDFYRRLSWDEGTSSGEPYAVFRTAGALLALFPTSLRFRSEAARLDRVAAKSWSARAAGASLSADQDGVTR